MKLSTIQIQIAGRKHTFAYPKAEEKMILSVLKGEDYPLAKVRITSDSPVIIDIGSNCGSAVMFFKSNYPNARIICYEPCASTYKLLENNIDPVDGVETNQCGIWDKEGIFRLHYGPEQRTGSFTLNQWKTDFGGEVIKTRKLTQEIERLNLKSIDILKIDAETAELSILYDLFGNKPEFMIHNIFVEYHGIVIRKRIVEDLNTIYDIHLCDITSDQQGTLLLVRK